MYYVEIRRKNRVRNLGWKQSHTRDSNPGPSLGRPEARPRISFNHLTRLFQASLPILLGGLGIIPASSIAEAAYAGSVIDTSDLANKLRTGIKEKHPYRLEEIVLEEVERTQDIHRLSDIYSLTGLLVRKIHGLRRTQRFLSQGIHAVQSDRLFSSLKKRDVLQKAHLLSCREKEASDWLRASPNPKCKSAVSGALWNTMVSLRARQRGDLWRLELAAQKVGQNFEQKRQPTGSLVKGKALGYTPVGWIQLQDPEIQE